VTGSLSSGLIDQPAFSISRIQSCSSMLLEMLQVLSTINKPQHNCHRTIRLPAPLLFWCGLMELHQHALSMLTVLRHGGGCTTRVAVLRKPFSAACQHWRWLHIHIHDNTTTKRLLCVQGKLRDNKHASTALHV
jgi:hypothetical protein